MPGSILELALHALLVARGREGQLQVGAFGDSPECQKQ